MKLFSWLTGSHTEETTQPQQEAMPLAAVPRAGLLGFFRRAKPPGKKKRSRGLFSNLFGRHAPRETASTGGATQAVREKSVVKEEDLNSVPKTDILSTPKRVGPPNRRRPNVRNRTNTTDTVKPSHTPTNSPAILSHTPTNSPAILSHTPTSSPAILSHTPTSSPAILSHTPTSSPAFLITTSVSNSVPQPAAKEPPRTPHPRKKELKSQLSTGVDTSMLRKAMDSFIRKKGSIGPTTETQPENPSVPKQMYKSKEKKIFTPKKHKECLEQKEINELQHQQQHQLQHQLQHQINQQEQAEDAAVRDIFNNQHTMDVEESKESPQGFVVKLEDISQIKNKLKRINSSALNREDTVTETNLEVLVDEEPLTDERSEGQEKKAEAEQVVNLVVTKPNELSQSSPFSEKDHNSFDEMMREISENFNFNEVEYKERETISFQRSSVPKHVKLATENVDRRNRAKFPPNAKTSKRLSEILGDATTMYNPLSLTAAMDVFNLFDDISFDEMNEDLETRRQGEEDELNSGQDDNHNTFQTHVGQDTRENTPLKEEKPDTIQRKEDETERKPDPTDDKTDYTEADPIVNKDDYAEGNYDLSDIESITGITEEMELESEVAALDGDSRAETALENMVDISQAKDSSSLPPAKPPRKGGRKYDKDEKVPSQSDDNTNGWVSGNQNLTSEKENRMTEHEAKVKELKTERTDEYIERGKEEPTSRLKPALQPFSFDLGEEPSIDTEDVQP